MSFAIGAALGFVVVGIAAIMLTPRGTLREEGQTKTLSGAVDLLSVAGAVTTAYGISKINGFLAWPLTGAGTAGGYLLLSGLDVLIARTAARHTSFGRSQ